MATTEQKTAARRNIAKARDAQRTKAPAAKKSSRSRTLTTAAKNKLPDRAFAFPKERKEPLIDARHVRNAIARFDQVEGVSDADRDAAWKRILEAAKKHGVEVHEKSWRELPKSKTKSKSK